MNRSWRIVAVAAVVVLASRIAASGKASAPLFSCRGRAGIGGSLVVVSHGPFGPGQTFTGTWGTLSEVLSHCGSYLKSAAIPTRS